MLPLRVCLSGRLTIIVTWECTEPVPSSGCWVVIVQNCACRLPTCRVCPGSVRSLLALQVHHWWCSPVLEVLTSFLWIRCYLVYFTGLLINWYALSLKLTLVEVMFAANLYVGLLYIDCVRFLSNALYNV